MYECLLCKVKEQGRTAGLPLHGFHDARVP